jgi:tetratricopeptide (TPR) repeat protein
LALQATKAEGQKRSLAPAYEPSSARDAIETATRLQKEKGDYAQAVLLYVRAMEMRPNDDEARAALYNMGCALAKQKQWDKATDCIMQAVNNYSLKLSVALKVWQADAASNCACATRPAPTKH